MVRRSARWKLLKPDDVRLALGRRIAELRTERGWTQAVFAQKMRWSVQYASRVERGSENFRLTRLVDIANVLHVALDLLLIPPASLEVRRGRPPRAPT
jgi:transcriptional regulator with XRE-family HTH domain